MDFQHVLVHGLVRMEVVDAKSPLTLDAVSMEIKEVKVNKTNRPFAFDKKAGSLTIDGIPKGKAEVEVRYEKQVSDEVIFGLYKSKYGSEYLLVTDLEPAEARTVLPCVDDPSYKAIFKVKVTADKSLNVISNATVKSQKDASDGRRVTIFRPTPRMSTYLFFLGIGRFESRSLKKKGSEVIVAARPNQQSRMPFILGVGSELVKAYGDYFGIPYPLDKLHLVALPEYHTGAMENWGAIASRESYILLDENSSTYDKRYAAYVVSHEIAHQWFGDLVTMKWWDDLWLNESFATFTGYKILDKVHPDWGAWSEFLRRETLLSLRADALQDTHPVQVHVTTPSEISQVFDAVSYGKGATVLRMIEEYLGEDAFRRGVSDYLRKFSYSNARGDDLWKSLERASGQPISRIMEEWIQKPGFPVVKVNITDGKVKLAQRRFFLSGEEGNVTWPIPLVFNLNGKRRTTLFDSATMDIPASRVTSLKVNPQQTGFYSVLYDDRGYDMLAKSFQSLTGFDRLGVLTDLFLFLLAGKTTPEQYFRFFDLCKTETDYAVLRGVVAQVLQPLYPIAADIPAVRRHISGFALSQLRRLGTAPKKGEDPADTVVRGEIANIAVLTDENTAETFARKFDDYATLGPDLREAAVMAYSGLNGSKAYDRLVKMVKATDSEVDRAKLYRGILSLRQPELVEKMLELGISGEVSRSDTAYTLTNSAANPYARDVTWSWVEKRFQKLWEIYAGSQQILIYMEFVVPLCGLGHEAEVVKFLSSRMEQGGMPFKRAMERLRTNVSLRKKLLTLS